jgi:hypothetical protein
MSVPPELRPGHMDYHKGPHDREAKGAYVALIVAIIHNLYCLLMLTIIDGDEYEQDDICEG